MSSLAPLGTDVGAAFCARSVGCKRVAIRYEREHNLCLFVNFVLPCKVSARKFRIYILCRELHTVLKDLF